MRPGRDSDAGFLGPKERLGNVLKEDAATLAELQLSRSALADRLRQLLDARGSAFEAREPRPRPAEEEIEIVAGPDGELVRVAGRFDVTFVHYWGWQDCPWRGLGPWGCRNGVQYYATVDWEIANLRTGRCLSGPGLIVHLIAAHGFFEGKESPYRVDPRALAEVLELGRFAESPS
jgi:hypothetical protein